MVIYLMRHGEAKAHDEAPARPLTAAGRATVNRVSAAAAALGVKLDSVYHSGITRAKETAEILAAHLGIQDSLAARDGLAPLDPVEPVARWLLAEAASAEDRPLAIVGHLPFLERLASRLVAGDEDGQVVAFEPASLLKLVPKREGSGYTVAWLVPPQPGAAQRGRAGRRAAGLGARQQHRPPPPGAGLPDSTRVRDGLDNSSTPAGGGLWTT